MPNLIVRKNAYACLANCGEMGYWVIAKISGKRIRLCAGGSLDKAIRVFNWYKEV